jgi:glycosyltransferase involved in cell wall biosynthesis
LTAILLTLNEEENLPGALDALRDVAERVFVVDSLSTDATVDIALGAGAEVVQRPFTHFGDQWNWALRSLPIESPWTLKIDPDERPSAELRDELAARLSSGSSSGSSPTGYWIRRRLWFMGQPMRQMQWVLRVWRTGRCRFSDVIVNEHPIVDGNCARLGGLLEHVDSPDLQHWIEKQNRYSTMEAIMQARGDEMSGVPRLFGNEMERRLYMKRLFRSVPFRYTGAWLYHAIARGAILDGRIGLAWTRLRIEHYYRSIELKRREIEATGKIPSIPRAAHGDYDPRVLASPLQSEIMRAESPA